MIKISGPYSRKELSKETKAFIFDHLTLKKEDDSDLEGLSMLQNVILNELEYSLFFASVEEKSHPIAVGLYLTNSIHLSYPGLPTIQVYVRNEYRRKGIGKILFDKICNELHFKSIRVVAWDKRSEQFYKNVEMFRSDIQMDREWAG